MPWGENVRVLAATFQDESAAERVLGSLREAYGLRGSDAAVAPVAGVGSDAGQAVLLAGRFYEDRVPVVRDFVEREGGRVVIDVDEAATKRRETPLPASRADERRAQPSRLGDRGDPTRIFF
jgi:hypothetical protein